VLNIPGVKGPCFYPVFFGATRYDEDPLEHSQSHVYPSLKSLVERLPEAPLSLEQLNELLYLTNRRHVTADFFSYYFLSSPQHHPYRYSSLLEAAPNIHHSRVASALQLEFGIRRFLADSLMYFPSTQVAHETLGGMRQPELASFFATRCMDTDHMEARTPPHPLQLIDPEDRWLLSELACKAYATDAGLDPVILTELTKAWRDKHPTGKVPVKPLVAAAIANNPEDFQLQLALPLGTEEIEDQEVNSEDELRALVGRITDRFNNARQCGLANTRYYLAMLNELDVYVATSMRSRADFLDMARNCHTIFDDPRLLPLQLRYFDPTLSAAKGHEDKGLLECAMVDAAKVVLYFAQEGESWGKDTEASRGLGQGKPVIIYTPDTPAGHRRMLMFRDVHPLSRLVDPRTGIAVGALITNNIRHVIDLLVKTFTNGMEYLLDWDQDGYLRLREAHTRSVVRIRTADPHIAFVLDRYSH